MEGLGLFLKRVLVPIEESQMPYNLYILKFTYDRSGLFERLILGRIPQMNVSVIYKGGKTQGVKAVLGVWGEEEGAY